MFLTAQGVKIGGGTIDIMPPPLDVLICFQFGLIQITWPILEFVVNAD